MIDDFDFALGESADMIREATAVSRPTGSRRSPPGWTRKTGFPP